MHKCVGQNKNKKKGGVGLLVSSVRRGHDPFLGFGHHVLHLDLRGRLCHGQWIPVDVVLGQESHYRSC